MYERQGVTHSIFGWPFSILRESYELYIFTRLLLKRVSSAPDIVLLWMYILYAESMWS